MINRYSKDVLHTSNHNFIESFKIGQVIELEFDVKHWKTPNVIAAFRAFERVKTTI